MKTISVVGSCQSRDVFNSKFVENYKDYFEFYSYFTMTSMLTMMSDPIEYNYKNLLRAEFKEFMVEHWFQQFEKTLLRTLDSKKPDILLMDFYAEARRGAISYKGEYITNRVKLLKGKKIIDFNNLGIKYNYEENSNDFFMMWKNCFDRFMDFMQTNLPETTIVINTVKGTNIIEDSSGRKYVSENIKHLDVDKMNALWKTMDEYAIHTYNLKAILYEKEYTMDPDYLFGGVGYATVHFHNEYYQDCFKKLVDIAQSVKGVTSKESNTNLVIDSRFKKLERNWTNITCEYELVPYSKYNAIRIKQAELPSESYKPQLWSKPIEILGDGKTTYTLSFNVKIADVKNFEEDTMIFAIRTFKNISEIKYVDAIEGYKLTVKGHKIKSNQEYRYVFSFKPQGKYIKLAPFMHAYISDIEYSCIKLERAKNPSEYTG